MGKRPANLEETVATSKNAFCKAMPGRKATGQTPSGVALADATPPKSSFCKAGMLQAPPASSKRGSLNHPADLVATAVSFEPSAANGGDAAAGGDKALTKQGPPSPQLSRNGEIAPHRPPHVLPQWTLPSGAPCLGSMSSSTYLASQPKQQAFAVAPIAATAAGSSFASQFMPCQAVSSSGAHLGVQRLQNSMLTRAISSTAPVPAFLPLSVTAAGAPLDLQCPPISTISAHGSTNGERLNEVQTSLLKTLAGGKDCVDFDGEVPTEQLKDPVLIDVRHLRFVHATIVKTFAHGEQSGLPIQNLLDDLQAARLSPTDLAPLTVMRTDNGLEVVSGNRRLYCLKRFTAEANITVSVWCRVYDLKGRDTPRPLVMKYILASTAQNAGGVTSCS